MPLGLLTDLGAAHPVLLDSFCEIEFKLLDIDLWMKADISIGDYLTAIKTGLLKNKPIVAVKLMEIDQGQGGVATFIYNIEYAKKGLQPWSVECR